MSILSAFCLTATAQYANPSNQQVEASAFEGATITNTQNKLEVLNKNIIFAGELGAAASRCPTLSEAVLQGWPQARMLMIQELTTLGYQQAETSLSIDRAFQSARTAAEATVILKDCDMVLNKMYQFQATH